MKKIVRYSMDDLRNEPLSPESIAQLKRLAAMPDSEIRTDLIPEVHFDLELAAARRKAGWRPGQQSSFKKAS